jgi:hypothetical protein
LAALDAEHPDHQFAMSRIVARLYALSPDLQERRRQAVQREDALRAEMRSLADDGDAKAKMWLMLDASIKSWSTRPKRLGRKRERKKMPTTIEADVNPSRCMRALVARGLVRGRRGWFGLTPLGKESLRGR